MSRRYDPAREPDLLIAVDMQTRPGDWWLLNWDDDLVEGLCIAALSFARSFIGNGIAVGLAINAFSDRPQRTVYVPPSGAGGQIAEMADRLADVSPFASVPFERLLADVARRAPLGCSILALSGRDPVEFIPTLRRLRAQGYLATHAAFGPRAAGWSAHRARSGCRVPGTGLIPTGRRPMRSNASPEAALSVLAAALLEAAWITLVYVTVEFLAGPDRQAPLSLVAFAGAALVGLGFARTAGHAGRQAYRTTLAAIAVAAALVGWLLPLGPAAAHVLDEPAVVFGMHPAGILLGFAVLRGSAHTTGLDDERIAETALGPGLAGVAGLWVFLTATGGTAEPSVVRHGNVRDGGLRHSWLGEHRSRAVGGSAGLGCPGRRPTPVGRRAVRRRGRSARRRGAPRDAPWGPLGRCHPSRSRRRRRGRRGRRHALHPAGCPPGDGPLPGHRAPARDRWGRDEPTQADLIGGAALDVQALLGPGGDGPDLSLVALVIAIVVAFVLVRALVKRPGRTVVDGDVVEVREAERPDRDPPPPAAPAGPAAPSGPAERERGVRGEPRRSWRDGPSRCAARPRRPPSTPAGSAPIRSDRRWDAWPPITR